MNNSTNIESLKNCYARAIEFQANESSEAALEMFLKAASFANDISINSKALNIRFDYCEIALKLLNHAKNIRDIKL